MFHELKIEILKKSKDFSIDEIHAYLKVLGLPTDNDYGKYQQDHYLSQSIADVQDEEILKKLSKSFEREPKNEIRVWKDGYYRLFMSHRSEYKKEVAEIKGIVEEYGIDAFVAHEDIQVSVEWRDALVFSLKSMHALLAYITDDFSGSEWCSQEIGFACVNGTRIIPLRVGTTNPAGFLGFYQAGGATGNSAKERAMMIISKLLETDFDQYIQNLLFALGDNANFNKTKNILELLKDPSISLTKSALSRLEEIFANNDQVSGYYHAATYLRQIKTNSGI